MNRIYTTLLLVFLVTFYAAPISGIASAADLHTQSIDVEGVVHHPDIQVSDVTARYAAGLDGKSRANGDHWYFNLAENPDYDYVMDVIVTADGGSVVAGYNNDVTSAFNDAFLLRYDAEGYLVWASGLNLGGHDYYSAVCELPDGTFVATGKTEVLSETEPRVLLVKYNTNGTIQWARLAGNSAPIYPVGICYTTDDTLAVGGNGLGYGPAPLSVMLLEFDLTGDLLQTTVFGAAGGNNILRSFSATSDGGFIAAGWSSSFATHTHGLLIKFADPTTVSWSTVVGDDIGYSYLFDAVEAPNGDFFASGATEDYDPSGTLDVLVARFGADGTLYWARSLGDAGVDEEGNSLALREGGGFMVVGDSDAGSLVEDALLIDFDDVGGLQWVRILGDDGWEHADQVHNLPDGGYLLAGTRRAYGTSHQDAILAAVDGNGQIPGCPHIRTWDTYSPLRTPAWSAVTLAVSTVALNEQAHTTTAIDPYFTVGSLCDYETPEVEYWLVASGTDDTDRGKAIGLTPDGGYLVAAEASISAGRIDVLLLKYDALGELQWARTTGDIYSDQPRDLLVTDDGGCVVVGQTSSYGAGITDALILGFDPGGSLLWSSTVGGTETEWIYSIHQRLDGHYQVVGATNSFGSGMFDMLMVEVNQTGAVLSVRAVGSEANEVALRGIPLRDGGSVLAGFSNPSGGNEDAIAIRVEDDGSYTWCSESGTAGDERFYGIVELPDGDLMLGGTTDSYGSEDILLVRLGSTGGRQYFRTTGTADDEYLYDLKLTTDGSVVGCGFITQSPAGYFDALLCRFDDQAQPLWARRVGGTTSEEFDSVLVNENGGFAAAGLTGSFGVPSWEAFVTRTDEEGMVDDCPYFSTETFTTSEQYPPSGSYLMTSALVTPTVLSPSPWQSNYVLNHLLLCSALPPTISAFITGIPSWGTVPFNTMMEVDLTNNYTEQNRRIAARIDLTVGNGNYYPNWRAGYTNLAPGENRTTSWMQNIPALGTVIGENRFHLIAEDVTPPPYNHPPYVPAGDTDTSLQIVTAIAP